MNVPCLRCGAAVELSHDAYERVKSLNAILLARRDRPLAENEITTCAECYPAHRRGLEFAARVSRDEVEQLLRDVHDGRVRIDRWFWASARVKAIQAGPWAALLEDGVRRFLQPALNGGGDQEMR